MLASSNHLPSSYKAALDAACDIIVPYSIRLYRNTAILDYDVGDKNPSNAIFGHLNSSSNNLPFFRELKPSNPILFKNAVDVYGSRKCLTNPNYHFGWFHSPNFNVSRTFILNALLLFRSILLLDRLDYKSYRDISRNIKHNKTNIIN